VTLFWLRVAGIFIVLCSFSPMSNGLRGSQKTVLCRSRQECRKESDFPVKVYSCCVISLVLIPLFRLNDVILFRATHLAFSKAKDYTTKYLALCSPASLWWLKKLLPNRIIDSQLIIQGCVTALKTTAVRGSRKMHWV
jgi:hypothetical protein